MNRTDLVALVQRIMNVEGTEDEIDEMVELLAANVPDPNVSDLIFHSRPELTAEQVVDRALAYKPLITP